jgi:hypothetical protein
LNILKRIEIFLEKFGFILVLGMKINLLKEKIKKKGKKI